ncbi:MAG: flagellar biosynthesis protein FlhF [bacterium]
MIINRYRANNLKAAIEKANAEMGPEAKVLHVRQLNSNNGTVNRGGVEIIAVVDEDITGKTNLDDQIDNTSKSSNIDLIVEDSSYQDNNNTENNINNGNLFRNSRNTYSLLKKYSSNLANQNKGTAVSENMENKTSYLPDDNSSEEKNIVKSNEDLMNTDPLDNLKNDMWLSLASKQNSSSQNLKSEIKQNSLQNEMIGHTGIRVSSNQRQIAQKSKSRISYVLHNCLTRNQVDSEYTYDILSLINEYRESTKEMTAKDYLEIFISRKIKMSGGLDESKKVSILIGPTGVGKTTTLAKLAAQYHFQKEKSVGLITIDAYRIAAIDQLKTYAHIMSMPLKVALTPEDLEKCINDYEDMDLILVDTPGRSQLNTVEIRNIEEFLESAQPADTHLLIPTSIKESDAYTIVETFAPEYVQNLLFTKLDETLSFGSILNISMKAKKPISYFTTGQNVPDDIKLAEVSSLVNLFINRNPIGKLT